MKSMTIVNISSSSSSIPYNGGTIFYFLSTLDLTTRPSMMDTQKIHILKFSTSRYRSNIVVSKMCCFSPSIFKDWLCPSINDLTIRLSTTGIICALLSLRITITTVVTTLTLKKFTPDNCNPNIILRTFMHHLSVLEQDCKLQTYIMHRFIASLPGRLAFFVRAGRLKKLA